MRGGSAAILHGQSIVRVHGTALNTVGARKGMGIRTSAARQIMESEVDKRATAGSNPAGSYGTGRQDLRSPPLRKVLGSAPHAGC